MVEEEKSVRGEKTLKVLVAAYACAPGMGSEPGVGWNIIKEISRFAVVYAVVSRRYRESIEGYLSDHPYESVNDVTWVYVDPPRWVLVIKNRFHLGTQVHYWVWQWFALAQTKRLMRDVRFDVAHHLTYGVSWLAPTLALLNIPFVWGPIGGGDLVPQAVLAKRSVRVRMQESVYRLITGAFMYLSPLSYRARRKADLILFRTRSTERKFPLTTPEKRMIMCETAWPVPVVGALRPRKSDGLRVVCVGRMEYWKAFPLGVEGFFSFLRNGGKGELSILGEGPDRVEIERMCELNEHGSVVQMRGRVSRECVLGTLENSDVLLHPSFRDGGSWAVLEAMSMGIPVVCVDASGPADMVSDCSGIRVVGDNVEQLVRGIGTALLALYEDEALRVQLGMGAKTRVNECYQWHQKGDVLKRAYEEITA